LDAAIKTFPEALTALPIKVFFQDEARFGRINVPVRCWAPIKLRPILPKQLIREYLYVFGAVCPFDGDFDSLICQECHTDIMNVFLNQLSRSYANNRNVIFMDKASWHQSKELLPLNNIRIILLPPYSPELNPAEHIWEHIREKYLANVFIESNKDLEDRLAEALLLTGSDQETLKSLTAFNWLFFNN
jgi:hypothetical protein